MDEGSYIDRICRSVRPKLCFGKKCSEWIELATEHCAQLVLRDDEPYDIRILWRSFLTLLFPRRRSKWQIDNAKVPMGIYPSQLTPHDCKIFFEQIASDCLNRQEELKKEKHFNNLLMSSLCGAGVLILFLLLFLLCLWVKKQWQDRIPDIISINWKKKMRLSKIGDGEKILISTGLNNENHSSLKSKPVVLQGGPAYGQEEPQFRASMDFQKKLVFNKVKKQKSFVKNENKKSDKSTSARPQIHRESQERICATPNIVSRDWQGTMIFNKLKKKEPVDDVAEKSTKLDFNKANQSPVEGTEMHADPQKSPIQDVVAIDWKVKLDLNKMDEGGSGDCAFEGATKSDNPPNETKDIYGKLRKSDAKLIGPPKQSGQAPCTKPILSPRTIKGLLKQSFENSRKQFEKK